MWEYFNKSNSCLFAWFKLTHKLATSVTKTPSLHRDFLLSKKYFQYLLQSFQFKLLRKKRMTFKIFQNKWDLIKKEEKNQHFNQFLLLMIFKPFCLTEIAEPLVSHIALGNQKPFWVF